MYKYSNINSLIIGKREECRAHEAVGTAFKERKTNDKDFLTTKEEEDAEKTYYLLLVQKIFNAKVVLHGESWTKDAKIVLHGVRIKT